MGDEGKSMPNFQGLLGHRLPDTNLVLIGSGLFVARFSGVKPAVESWLEAHPSARVCELWREYEPRNEDRPAKDWRYVVVVDGADILNIHLVRHGHIPADTLECGPELRVIESEPYEAYLNLAVEAEAEAKAHRRGIWGDEFDYAVWIKDREEDLLRYVKEVLAGKVETELGRINFPAPQLKGKSRVRVTCVSSDKNKNVYFITNESFVSFNVGFVYKQGPLLGDGAEDTIAREEHLFGPWWFYVAH